MVDPLTLNLSATALVLFVVGNALAQDARRAPPFAGYAVGFLVLASFAAIRAGVPVEDWTVVFAAAFAAGWYVGEGHERKGPIAGVIGGALFAAIVLLLAVTHRWWYGPAGLLLALLAGVVRQGVAAWTSRGASPPADAED